MTSNFPLVSIIVPAYNSAEFLIECLQSLLDQTYPKVEVILVDDGSTDDTARLVKEQFPRVKYRWQPNSGTCSSPRNTGALLAEGEFFAFFDADDVMLPGCIEAHIEAMRLREDVGLSLVNYQNFESTDGSDLGPSHFDTCTELRQATRLGADVSAAVLDGVTARSILAEENFSIASGTLVRRGVFENLGGYDRSLRASEDVDLVFRAASMVSLAVSWPVGFRRRMHSANMSRQVARILQAKITSRTRWLESEQDSQVRSRLRGTLSELSHSVANSRGWFSRGERAKALVSSISYARRVHVGHVKALVKLAIGR